MEEIMKVLQDATKLMSVAQVSEKAGHRSVTHTQLLLKDMVASGTIVEDREGKTNPMNNAPIILYRAANRVDLDRANAAPEVKAPPKKPAAKKPAAKKLAPPKAPAKPKVEPAEDEALAQAEASAYIRGENVTALTGRLVVANHELIARAERIEKLEAELKNLAALNTKLEHLLNSSRNEAAMLRRHAVGDIGTVGPTPTVEPGPAVKFGTLYLERMPSMSEVERQAFSKLMLGLMEPAYQIDVSAPMSSRHI